MDSKLNLGFFARRMRIATFQREPRRGYILVQNRVLYILHCFERPSALHIRAMRGQRCGLQRAVAAIHAARSSTQQLGDWTKDLIQS